MRIIGIDPGFGMMGWAIIDDPLRMIAYGFVKTDSTVSLEERLLTIHKELIKIIAEYKPDVAAVERLFFSKNTTTALDVAKAMGVILLTLKMHEIPHVEYTPVQVKRTLTGYGRATKDQIQQMIKHIFKIQNCNIKDDVADAISVATCYCLNEKTLNLKNQAK